MNVYADNAATTAMSRTAIEAMLPLFDRDYGNPSSPHRMGRRAAAALQQARERVARCLGAQPGEIYFCSGGSEADNWALFSAAEAGAQAGKRHILSTAIEHPAVRRPLEALRERGFEIELLPVNGDGFVTERQVSDALRGDTCLVSVMYANNEIGTIQPVPAIGALCRERGVPFHTDAVQAAGQLPIDVHAQNIDLLSLSAHKFHGPKGVGALYARRGVPLVSWIRGGGQERGRRAGTENLPAIAGMAAALEEACLGMEENTARLTALREELIDRLSALPGSRLNGSRTGRLAGNVNFCFDGADGESLLIVLDRQGVCAGSGSACSSGAIEPSHVLRAIGRTPEQARTALRLSLCAWNTREETEYIAAAVECAVARLRDGRREARP